MYTTRIDRGLIMWKDTIVEKVRKKRVLILEKANFDIYKVIEDIKKLEATHKDKLVSIPFKRTKVKII